MSIGKNASNASYNLNERHRLMLNLGSSKYTYFKLKRYKIHSYYEVHVCSIQQEICFDATKISVFVVLQVLGFIKRCHVTR